MSLSNNSNQSLWWGKLWRQDAICWLKKELKVRLSQNEFMKSSIFQKMTLRIWRISALRIFIVHRAEILQIFWVIFWEIDDFINSFWLNLTFSSFFSQQIASWRPNFPHQRLWLELLIFYIRSKPFLFLKS